MAGNDPSGRRTALFLYTGLFIITMVLAVVAGPHSCEWGFTTYFFFGLAVLLVSGMAPLFVMNTPLNRRLLFGLLFAVLYVITWCAGIVLGNFRLICRLF